MEFTEIKNDFTSIKTRRHYKLWGPFMRKYDCQYVCELGVYKGDNFMQMIKHEPKLAVAIDAWRDDGINARNDAGYSQQELDDQYDYFKKLVSNKPFVRIIRDYTFNAVSEFPDNYFDFVYIDADHSFGGCSQDIQDWYPKVKPGKFLVGHDYSKGFGVLKAVNKFIQEQSLELMFLPHSNWAVVKK